MGDKNYNKIFNKNQKQELEKVIDSSLDPKEPEETINTESGEKEAEVNNQTSDVPTPPESKTVMVNKGVKLNLRKTASKDAEVLQILNPGDSLIMRDLNAGWANVITSSGVEGFVMFEFVKEI